MQIQNIDENLSMNISGTSGVSLQVSDVDTSLAMNVDTNDVINLNIVNEEGDITMEVETGYSKVEGTNDHSKLKNLDYAHSGHTGFQPKGDYVEDKNYVHTDNNFTDTEKSKLESLSNYDDTLIKKEVSSNTRQINALKTSVENKAEKTEIPDVSNFITKESDPTVPQHVKEIKQEDIKNWNNKPNKDDIPDVQILTGGDNTVIENNEINVYTNTGYIVSDKDMQLQTITDTETTGMNKIVYTDEEIMFIIDGSNKIRRSENGIDFEIITLPKTCKDMIYNKQNGRLIALSNNGYFFYSKDLGKTWEEKQVSNLKDASYLRVRDKFTGFLAVDIKSKKVTNLTENFTINGYVTSAIVPNFTSLANDSQFIWCNSSGTFKYGAGSNEGDFASLSGITINLLKRVNDITIVGLKNDNKMYLLEPATSIRDYKWVEYSLKDTCTVNDIIFNPNDETYYIFTDINTYYKTKDFVEYETVDKNGLRGIQGYFTLMGIQMTTSNHNELLLVPTRDTLENRLQEVKRLLDKPRWAGEGMEVVNDKLQPKINHPLTLTNNGIGLKPLDDVFMPTWIIEASYVAIAQTKEEPVNPYDMDSYYWTDLYPSDNNSIAYKLFFNQDGSFYDQMNWETEYSVQQNEYGYIYIDLTNNIFKYVKLGKQSILLN